MLQGQTSRPSHRSNSVRFRHNKARPVSAKDIQTSPNKYQSNQVANRTKRLKFNSSMKRLDPMAMAQLILSLLTANCLTIGGAAVVLTPHAAMAAIDPATHQRCLDAADYQGCVTVNNPHNRSSAPRCDQDGWCISKGGRDRFGLPRKKGWKSKYLASDNTVRYLDPQLRKVPHKNRSDRYFTSRTIVHDYEQPVAAVPGYYKTVGYEQTTCTQSGDWKPAVYSGGKLVSGGYNQNRKTTCKTTPPTRVWVPGKPGRAGGPRSQSLNVVYDCQDRTIGYYWNGQLRGDWKKAGSKSTRQFIKSTCANISSLPSAGLKL